MKIDRKDEKHLKFVRTLPCLKCRKAPSEAAHIRTAANSGTGLKPPDWHVVPLCSQHHRIQHQIGQLSFFGDVYATLRFAEALHKVSGDWKEACHLIVNFRVMEPA